jgi:hypothetical protein
MSGWGGGNDWPVPPESQVIANLRQSNKILRDELRGYHRKQFTGFWRGAIFGAVLATGAFVASAAWSETITIGSIYISGQEQHGTTVTISPSDVPDEWARVVMVNRYVNQGKDDGTYSLPFEGVDIPLEFLWDADPLLGSDRITLTPPDGITCIPEDCTVTVPEGMTGEIVLLDWRGF